MEWLLKNPAFWLACAMFFLPIKPAPVFLFLLASIFAVLMQPSYRQWLKPAVLRPDVLALCVFTLVLLGSVVLPGQTLSMWSHFAVKYGRFLLVPLLIPAMVDAKNRRLVACGFLSGMGLVLFLSYAMFFGVKPEWLGVIPNYEDGVLKYSVYKLHITHNFFMAVAICFWLQAAFEVWFSDRRKATWLLIVVGLALFNVFVMVQGRIGWLALMVIPVAMCMRRWGVRGILIGAAVSLGVIGMMYVLFENVHTRIDLGFRELWNLSPGANSTTSMGQRYVWVLSGLHAIAQSPWWGYGLGGFLSVVAPMCIQWGVQPFVNPHNQFVLFALQVGVPGLLLYLWVVMLQCRQALRTPAVCWYILPVFMMYFLANQLNSFHHDFSESILFVVCVASLGLGASVERDQHKA